jgi:hypothetical protein
MDFFCLSRERGMGAYTPSARGSCARAGVGRGPGATLPPCASRGGAHTNGKGVPLPVRVHPRPAVCAPSPPCSRAPPPRHVRAPPSPFVCAPAPHPPPPGCVHTRAPVLVVCAPPLRSRAPSPFVCTCAPRPVACAPPLPFACTWRGRAHANGRGGGRGVRTQRGRAQTNREGGGRTRRKMRAHANGKGGGVATPFPSQPCAPSPPPVHAPPPRLCARAPPPPLPFVYTPPPSPFACTPPSLLVCARPLPFACAPSCSYVHPPSHSRAPLLPLPPPLYKGTKGVRRGAQRWGHTGEWGPRG